MKKISKYSFPSIVTLSLIVFILLCSKSIAQEKINGLSKDSLIKALNARKDEPHNDLHDTMEYKNIFFNINRIGFILNAMEKHWLVCSKEYIMYKFTNKEGEVYLEHFSTTNKLLQKGYLSPVGPYRKLKTRSIEDHLKETTTTFTLYVNTLYLEKSGTWDYYDTLTNKVIKSINHKPVGNPEKLLDKRRASSKKQCAGYRRKNLLELQNE